MITMNGKKQRENKFTWGNLFTVAVVDDVKPGFGTSATRCHALPRDQCQGWAI